MGPLTVSESASALAVRYNPLRTVSRRESSELVGPEGAAGHRLRCWTLARRVGYDQVYGTARSMCARAHATTRAAVVPPAATPSPLPPFHEC